MTPTHRADRFQLVDLAPFGLGLAALATGTMLGWRPGVVETVVAPPAPVRALLIALAVLVGLALLRAAVRRLAGVEDAASADLPRMVRGIRLVFLAIAAFAAAAGWTLAHPLPIVVAFVIAGVDVVETSFLLLVVTLRRG